MVFEMWQADYVGINFFTYELGKKPIRGSNKRVDSVEWNEGKNKITIRSGFRFMDDVVLKNEIENTLGTYNAPDNLIHVSTNENEYFFSVRSGWNGGRVTIWEDGSTNQVVYVFEGCSGQIMEVDYCASYRPDDSFTSNVAMQTITEEFGQVALGRFKIPYNTTPVGTNIGQLKLQPSIIAREDDFTRPTWYNITRVGTVIDWNPLFLNPFDIAKQLNNSNTVQRQEIATIGGGLMTYRRYCDGQPNNINPDADGFDFFVGRFVE